MVVSVGPLLRDAQYCGDADDVDLHFGLFYVVLIMVVEMLKNRPFLHRLRAFREL